MHPRPDACLGSPAPSWDGGAIDRWARPTPGTRTGASWAATPVATWPTTTPWPTFHTARRLPLLGPRADHAQPALLGERLAGSRRPGGRSRDRRLRGKRHSTSGAKSDPGETQVPAERARTDTHRPEARGSELTAAVKDLARAHRSMVSTRQRQANQLRSTLWEFDPAALPAVDELAHRPSSSATAVKPQGQGSHEQVKEARRC